MRKGDAGNRAEMPGYSSGGSGRNPQGPVAGASNLTARRETPARRLKQLMEAVVERENMFKALHQVEANKGSAGVDGYAFEALMSHSSASTGRASEKNCWKGDISRNRCGR